MMTTKLINMDCMEYMKECEDNAFDLAIVDPPYGIGMSGGVRYDRPSRPNSVNLPVKHEKKDWDSKTPPPEYFEEVRRISKEQIIFGGNYFVENLKPSMGWVYWGKMENTSNFSDGELIYTSFQRALRSFYIHQFHMTRGGKDRIHPTQKPVELYKWLLINYATKGQRILDTHLGSGSSAIAAHYFGCDFVGLEIDEDYFKAAQERFKKSTAQIAMF